MPTSPFPPFSLIAAALTVDRGGRRVIEGIDLAVAAGDVVLLTGDNGVGKSTLIRALAGLVAPRSGSVRFEVAGGLDADDIGRHCHYLGHRDAVKSALTLAENLGFWRDFLGGEGASVPAALAAVDLADLADLPAAWLSAGQRRRLSLARLAVIRRPLWLLDEPTAGLDRASETRLVALMQAHVAVGGAIIAATHLDIALPEARHLRLSADSGAEAAPW